MSRRAVVIAALFSCAALSSPAWAGQVTVPIQIFKDLNTGNIAFNFLTFVNPNDSSVEFKFIIAEPTTQDCPGSGTFPSCTAPPPGAITNMTQNGDGVQTVTIPALGTFGFSAPEITIPEQEVVPETVSVGQVIVHATWPDEQVDTDGVRKVAPIKAFLNTGLFHFSGETPDEFKSISTSQVQ